MEIPQTKTFTLKPLIAFLEHLEARLHGKQKEQESVYKVPVGSPAYVLMVELDTHHENLSKLLDATDSLRQVMDDRSAVLRKVLQTDSILQTLSLDSSVLKELSYGKDRFGTYHLLKSTG